MRVQQTETPDTHPELLTAMVAAHERLQTVRLFARRGGARDFDAHVCTIALEAEDGDPVRYGHPPKDTASAIVATVMDAARRHTAETGDTMFQAQLYLAPGQRGPAPAKPVRVAFGTSVAVAPESDPQAELYIRIAEMLFKRCETILSATTALATAQVGMIEKLGSAFANIIERERNIASAQSETEMARIAAQMERERIAMLDRSLTPMLAALRRRLVPAASASDELPLPALAKQARDFVGTLTAAQRDLATRRLSSRGADALDRMRTASADADVLSCIADFVSEPTDAIMELYATLSPAQQAALEALQSAAAAAASASAEPSAAGRT